MTLALSVCVALDAVCLSRVVQPSAHSFWALLIYRLSCTVCIVNQTISLSRTDISISFLDISNAKRYYIDMIRNFKDKETEKIWNQIYSRKLPKEMQSIALRKLILIHRSLDINDLRVPPGNRLEPLTGNRKGQYSIRINKQWRICFKWEDNNAFDVEITDYH